MPTGDAPSIHILQAQDSSDSRSSPGLSPLHGLVCSGITARPVAGASPAEPSSSPGLPQAPPLRARPRGLARPRAARHLGCSLMVERRLRAEVRARSQGREDSELGKGVACRLGRRPTSDPSSSPCEFSLANSPASPGNLKPRNEVSSAGRRARGRAASFRREYFVRARGCAPASLGPRVLVLFSGSTK